MAAAPDETLERTALHQLHLDLGARMVPFAGYDMPVQYPGGIIAEHLHTRAKASLFDVSHMGQLVLRGEGAAAALEALAPTDAVNLAPGRMRYALLTDEWGGIRDDFMVANLGEALFLVVNAACKHDDIAHLDFYMPDGVALEVLGDHALLALQGPAAAEVLARHLPGVDSLPFMGVQQGDIAGIAVQVSRSGYTGEDGFEISVANRQAEALARRLFAEPEVMPAGLGARDSLRLEAGLCLHGHDIDTTTTPVEAGLAWTIPKRRRAEGGFPGADRILRELTEGPVRRRVGLLPEERAPAREGAPITTDAGETVGEVTSGGFGPSLGGPLAMGYVRRDCAAEGTALRLVVRGRARPARIVALPFVPHNYHRS